MKTDMDYIAEQCAEIDRRQGVKPTSSCMVDSVVGFSYVDVKSKWCEGWLNLLWGDYPVALVDNVHIAEQMRKVIPLHKPNAKISGGIPYAEKAG